MGPSGKPSGKGIRPPFRRHTHQVRVGEQIDEDAVASAPQRRQEHVHEHGEPLGAPRLLRDALDICQGPSGNISDVSARQRIGQGPGSHATACRSSWLTLAFGSQREQPPSRGSIRSDMPSSPNGDSELKMCSSAPSLEHERRVISRMTAVLGRGLRISDIPDESINYHHRGHPHLEENSPHHRDSPPSVSTSTRSFGPVPPRAEMLTTCVTLHPKRSSGVGETTRVESSRGKSGTRGRVGRMMSGSKHLDHSRSSLSVITGLDRQRNASSKGHQGCLVLGGPEQGT